MIVTEEMTTYYEIKEMSWSCDKIWEKIEEFELEDEAMQRLEMLFTEPVDKTALNDYIRFELWDDMDLDSYKHEDEDEEESYEYIRRQCNK